MERRLVDKSLIVVDRLAIAVARQSMALK